VNNFVTPGRQRGTTDAKEGTVSNPVQMRPSREGCKAALEGGSPEFCTGTISMDLVRTGGRDFQE